MSERMVVVPAELLEAAKAIVENVWAVDRQKDVERLRDVLASMKAGPMSSA